MTEPFEEKYNEILKQRLSLEGEVAMWKIRYEQDLAKYKKRANWYILLLMLLPLTTFLCKPQPAPSVDWLPIAAERDSIKNLLEILSKTKIRSIQYIVKKGDNPAALGQLFFNDEKAAYQIIKDNNLDVRGFDRELRVGDKLSINFR